MRVLDLFCGGGGASEGYADLGCEVFGIDIDPQPMYPYAFLQADALEVLGWDAFIRRFDFIHASPPCQPYSKAVTSSSSQWNDTKGKDEPALVDDVRVLLQRTGIRWVIENVPGAPLRRPVTLCGSMFGLDIPRHRLIEASFPLAQPGHPPCRGMAKRAAERRGWDYRDMSVTGKGRRKGWSDRAAELLGIRHPMRQHDLKEAIPPAYTEYIARQVEALRRPHPAGAAVKRRCKRCGAFLRYDAYLDRWYCVRCDR